MKQDVIALIRKTLLGQMSFLVLRGHDDHARAEGDIDILVPRGQAVFACRFVAESARCNGWYLLSFRYIGYLASIVLVRPADNGHDAAIKIDFFSGLEWYGVGDGSVSARFFERILPEAQARNELEPLAAAVNFFQKCMVVGRLSQRDWDRITAGGATGDYLMKVAGSLQLPLQAADIAARGLGLIDKWRFRAASAAPGGAVSRIGWLSQIVCAHLRSKAKIGFFSGNVFGLSGLDGSGKSTQMDRLLASYKKSGVIMPRLIHLLPEWIPLPHQIIRRKKTVNNYTRPYAEPPVSSRLSGTLRLAYYIIAFATAKVGIQLSAKRDSVLVMDRCFADFVADLSRARIPARNLPGWLMALCSPVGCLIYLDASAETVVRRKGELTLEKASELRDRYFEVFGLIRGHVLNGEGTPTEVYSRILDRIDTVYYKRICFAGRRYAES